MIIKVFGYKPFLINFTLKLYFSANMTEKSFVNINFCQTARKNMSEIHKNMANYFKKQLLGCI